MSVQCINTSIPVLKVNGHREGKRLPQFHRGYKRQNLEQTFYSLFPQETTKPCFLSAWKLRIFNRVILPFLIPKNFLDDVVKSGLFPPSLPHACISGAAAAAYVFSAWFRKLLFERFWIAGPSVMFDGTTFSTCNPQHWPQSSMNFSFTCTVKLNLPGLWKLTSVECLICIAICSTDV